MNAPVSGARQDPSWIRWTAFSVTFGFLGLLVAVPLVSVFANACSKGLPAYWAAISHPDTLSALRMTLFAAAVAVPLNAVCGFAAAWLLTRFRFPGRDLLASLIDLPFSVSPVVSGLVFVLLLGAQGWFGPALADLGIRVIFTPWAIALATVFVTFPFVARELIPVMEEQGHQAEEAAVMLGARGWDTIRRVTLPSVKWAMLYGIILCNARAIGEFGAVSVVSGHIRGETNTLPLHAEILYNEYDFAGAFAVASLLALAAGATVVLKSWLQRREGK